MRAITVRLSLLILLVASTATAVMYEAVRQFGGLPASPGAPG